AAPRPLGEDNYLVLAQVGNGIDGRAINGPNAKCDEKQSAAGNKKPVAQRPFYNPADHRLLHLHATLEHLRAEERVAQRPLGLDPVGGFARFRVHRAFVYFGAYISAVLAQGLRKLINRHAEWKKLSAREDEIVRR